MPDITNLGKVHLGLTALGVGSIALGQRVRHGGEAVGQAEPLTLLPGM